jgi:serpin B
MRLFSLLIVALVLLTLSGCAPAEVAIAQSDRPRELAPDVPEADQKDLAEGNRAFAFDLYQAIREDDENLFYSPYSLSLALAMTYAGARAETERQMADTLHFTLPQEQLHPAFNGLDLALTRDAEDETFTLKIANSLWGQSGYPLRPEFLDLLAVNYGAGLRLVDFMDASRREQARAAINNWVSDQTEGKIKELLAEDILTEWTRLVLVNAIYFNAKWKEPFNPGGTQAEVFNLLDGSQVTVPMMSRRAITGYVEGSNYQAVELEYKGDRARMLILLPAPGQFAAFEQSLNNAVVDEILQAIQPTDVKLFLPKFSYDASLSLKDTLAEMGMPDAFDMERADFSGIAPIPPRLYISHVEHKAFVAVDELGTEAAAATGVVGEIVSLPVTVRVDRPFIFVIYDTPTHTILFVGRVLNPGK